MRTSPGRAWTWLRDAFSSNVLGTTSASPPSGLGGGMSRPARLTVTAVSFALALGAAMLTGSAQGASFFYPALMIAGIFGGAGLALISLCLAIAAAQLLFGAELHLWLFVAASSLQTGAALGLRVLFRESRRWGVRYRRLLSAMSQAVTVSDDEGRIERPHPELGRLIGMEWPAYRGTRWLASVHADDQAKLAPPRPFKEIRVQRAEIRLKSPASGDWRWHLMRAVPLVGEDGEVEEWISILTDVHERKLAGEQREVVVGEARHRLKNLITIIESLAKSSQPREKEGAVEAFLDKFFGRLRALSAASDLALAGNYTTLPVEDVARATLAPFLETEAQRFTIAGPRVELREATGGALALGLNELATNAIKYGALSVPQGSVSFTWTLTPEDGGELLAMEWRESGGPPPRTPQKEGYGSRVIKFIPNRERGGSVTFDYAPQGYVCRIAFKLPARPRVKTLEPE